MPELGHLSPDERRQALRSSGAARGQMVLILQSLVLGGVAGALARAALPLSGVGWAVAQAFGSLVLAAVAAGWYQLQMVRARAALRFEIMRQFRGEKLPVCLRCGYNLQASQSERCPECNAPVRVPDEV